MTLERLTQITSVGISSGITLSGATLTGVTTLTTLSAGGDIDAVNGTFSGNLNVAGVLTYEDVSNVDSVGVVTARSGLHVTGGSVGIGTDNPAEKLEVYGNVRFKDPDGSHGIEFYPDVAGLGYQRIISYNRTSSAYESLSIGVDNFIVTQGSSSERFRIDSSGLVGIGSDSPTAPLNVLNNNANTPTVWIQNVSGGGDSPALRVQGGANNNNTVGTFEVRDYDGNVDFKVGGTGFVGIGTDNPTEKLSVDGAIESLSDGGNTSTEGGQFVMRAPRTQTGTKYRYLIDNYWGESAFGRAVSGSNQVSGFRLVREDDADQANGQVLMSIAQDGIMYLPYQPAFDAVYDSGGGATGYTSSNTEIVFNVTNNNRGSHFSTSTGRFTAPIQGTYFFSFGGMNNSSDTLWYELRVNGSLLTNPHNPYMSVQNGSGFRHITSQYTLALNDGDYVSVFTGGTSGGIYGGGNNHNHFVGYLIG